MAKKPKSKPPEEEVPEVVEEAVADEEVVEDAAVEEAEVEAVEEADVETEAVEDADVEEAEAAVDEEVAVADDADGGEEPPESVDEGPKRPRPRLTVLQLVLILLNLIAAPAFLFAAAMDYKARLDYAYRAVLNYTQVWGIPLREEEDFPSLSNETRPRVMLTKEQLKKAAQSRKATPGGEYASVDEPVPIRLRPSDMTEELTADIFRGLPNPVITLEAEIDRLKSELPKLIAAAADEVAKSAKDDNEKRSIVHKTLFPLVGSAHIKDKATKDTPYNVWEVDRLNEKLEKSSGAELDDWVKNSVQRRIYYDILAPINIYRPGDAKRFQIERLGDQSVTIDEIKNYLIDRLAATIAENYDAKTYLGPDYLGAGAKNDTVEKRHKIAFVLFALSQVQKPILNKKLLDKGVERAQTISGLYEFTNAAIFYVRTIQILEERRIAEIKLDREGGSFKPANGPLTRTEGFVDQYEAEVDRLVILYENIVSAKKRLDDLTNRKNEFTKIQSQRKDHYDEIVKKLRNERATTAKYADDLRALQQQMHKALTELSDAAAVNLRLVEEIGALEKSINSRFTSKGGKK